MNDDTKTPETICACEEDLEFESATVAMREIQAAYALAEIVLEEGDATQITTWALAELILSRMPRK